MWIRMEIEERVRNVSDMGMEWIYIDCEKTGGKGRRDLFSRNLSLIMLHSFNANALMHSMNTSRPPPSTRPLLRLSKKDKSRRQ